jgi:type IV secretion system protein VirB3
VPSVSERAATLIRETLFVGATRPSMRFGVTYAALLLNLITTMELFLLSKNLLVLGIALPIHGLSALLCARDPRIFDLLLLWMRTHAIALATTHTHFRAAAYGPLSFANPRATGPRRGAPHVKIG